MPPNPETNFTTTWTIPHFGHILQDISNSHTYPGPEFTFFGVRFQLKLCYYKSKISFYLCIVCWKNYDSIQMPFILELPQLGLIYKSKNNVILSRKYSEIGCAWPESEFKRAMNLQELEVKVFMTKPKIVYGRGLFVFFLF